MNKTKKQKKFIEESEAPLAARYLTLSNTAMLHYIQFGDLRWGYQRATDAMLEAVGQGLGEEYTYWCSQLDKGDPYCYDEWQKVREKYVK